MLPENDKNIAPTDRESLIEQAFYAIIRLDREEQKQILSKYALIYGIDLEGY